jgi:SHAQKYF class myb-like DNA-binding protein
MHYQDQPVDIDHGRWTDAEHDLFVAAYHKFGKNWKKISKMVTSRTNVQCRTHAQKLQSGNTVMQQPSAEPTIGIYTAMSHAPRVHMGADNKPEVRLEDIVAYFESRVKRVRAQY